MNLANIYAQVSSNMKFILMHTTVQYMYM